MLNTLMEISVLEHKSLCIHNVCTISSQSTFLQIHEKCTKSHNNTQKVAYSTFKNYEKNHLIELYCTL